MGYTNEEFEKEMNYKKNKLHLKYISGISFGCVCAVIILQCSDGKIFQNCISVSSTVVSIILSVIAIILSVTGERSTNEIRNKISDTADRLSKTTFDAESVNNSFERITKEQLDGFGEIKNSMEKLLIRLENIESETTSAKGMLTSMVRKKSNATKVQDSSSDKFTIEYISRLRKTSVKETINQLIDRIIELTLEDIDCVVSYSDMEKQIKREWKKLDDKDFPELPEEIVSVFLGFIICLKAIEYSDNTKEKILQITSQTKK
ncbi:MAG: hypothetical protein HFG28_05185 [Eubacterium sp.]|nr:hypothetical protein [Eubacterium sp.]